MKYKWGAWSFGIGLILAAIIAVISSGSPSPLAVLVIALLGVIVGLLNINDKEVMLFLVASIAFLITFQTLGSVIETMAFGWGAVSAFFNLLAIFVAPAAAIVAVKALYNITKD